MPARAAWLRIHLYLALSAGFLFALMGLTGSISVYRVELDELFNPQLVIEEPQGNYQSLDRIMVSVHKAHPDRYGSWTLEMPGSSHGMITVWYDKPRETVFELYAPLMVSVNPYTAEVVASRFWGQTAATWLLDLHTQLRLARFGWNAVGILGLLLMISVATGLYLWWPGITGLRSALKIRHRAGMIQFAFDLHRLIGLLSAPALLLLAFTGFLLIYPSVPESLTGSSGMEHGETGRTIPSTAIPNNHPVGLESAEFIARGPFPRAQLRRVTTPAGNAGIYRINLRQDGEINQRHPFTTVWVDRWSGHIKEVRNPAGFTTGETIATWIWPLHTGEALGAKGRFLWFVAGQSVFVLYVSGLLRWLYRRGMVKDRDVNLAALKPHFYRLIKMTRSMSLKLFHLIYLLIQRIIQYAPIIRKGWAASFLGLKRMLLIAKTHRQRPGKIN
ncbi:PepSY-associated TM helix domain-containing protein [Candidatus Methylobacter favarea]|uniref:PepSY-associated TM helix domain-containing protein n=1 Tax=Candidatus Methylobacter favarea TaxID=2707345 RepID=UPI001FE53BF9|nr:PepSY-associated TM helix domain-containing protein [Candidatus Methylobacter favarea]